MTSMGNHAPPSYASPPSRVRNAVVVLVILWSAMEMASAAKPSEGRTTTGGQAVAIANVDSGARPLHKARQNYGGYFPEYLLTRSLRCHYFQKAPVRTYCYVEVDNTRKAKFETDACWWLSMRRLNVSENSTDRLCALRKLFELDQRNLSIVVPSLHSQDKCQATNQDPNVTHPHPKCEDCNRAFICEAGYYYHRPNDAACVTTDAGPLEVEYCLQDQLVNAAESSAFCQSKSAHLVDLDEFDFAQGGPMRTLYRRGMEFWLYVDKDDVSQLPGAIAFDKDNVDWNTTCLTAWLGYGVPWFFTRNCGDRMNVICGEKDDTERIGTSYCFYIRLGETRRYFCFPEINKYNHSAGADLCDQVNMKRLGVGNVPLSIYHPIIPEYLVYGPDGTIVWDANFVGFWVLDTANLCHGVDIKGLFINIRPRNCSQELRVICTRTTLVKGTPPPERNDLYCDQLNKTGTIRPPMCVNRDFLSFEESLRVCDGVGMSLLPEGFTWFEYDNLFNTYEEYSFQKEVTSYWVDPLNGNNETCTAIVRTNYYAGAFALNCSARLRAVCIGPPMVKPATTLEGTCPPPRPKPEAGNCDKKFRWPKDEHSSTCVTGNLLSSWQRILSSNDIEAMIDLLSQLDNSITSPVDVRTMPSLLKEALVRVEDLFRNLNPTDRANLARSCAETVAEVVSRVMLKTHAWSGIPQEERSDTAAELDNIVEDFITRLL